MKIGAVSHLGQVKANNVHFEAQNKERENRVAHSNPIKNTLVAVPLATLLAMSPLNSSAAERNSAINNANKTEQVEQTKFKVIQPAGRDYTILYEDGFWFASASATSNDPHATITFSDDVGLSFVYRANDGKLTADLMDGIRRVVGSEHHTEVICKKPRIDDAGEIVYDKFVLPCPDELYKFCKDFNNNNIPGFYTRTYPKIKFFERFVYTNRLNSENSNTRNANKTEQVEQPKLNIVKTIKPPFRTYEVEVLDNGELVVSVTNSDKEGDFDFIYQLGNEYWFGYRNYDGKRIGARLKGIRENDITFIGENKKVVKRSSYPVLVGEIKAKNGKVIEVTEKFSYFGLTAFCEDLNNNDIPGLDTRAYPKIKVLEPYVDEVDLVEMARLGKGD